MKRRIALLLTVLALLSLAACGKSKASANTSPHDAVDPNSVFEVKISLDNLYDYFEYREFKTSVKGDDGKTSSVQISYGLALKEGYTAANSPEYKDTMSITFTADGVVNSGDFDVDFNTLQYTGTVTQTERSSITESLSFWPKGDRTTTWTYGNYGSSYILYLENFTVTKASGSVYLRYAEQDASK